MVSPVTQAIGLLYMHAKKEELARKYLTRAKKLRYSMAIEWRDYEAAGGRYTPDPYGLGGIPNLFGDILNATDELLQTSDPDSTKKQDSEKST
jgi:hypothetical protein